MSINIEITYDNADQLVFLTEALTNRAPLHERMTQDCLLFVKEFGAQKSTSEHRTATNLGARATGHLAQAYEGIEGESDESAMRLLVPRDTRLRAAFGAYTLKPKNSKYLTLPVAAESYGKRAGEFEELTFLRVGPRQTAILARKDEEGNLTTMYLLVTSVNIPEDASLIPFDKLYNEAGRAAENYLQEIIEEELA